MPALLFPLFFLSGLSALIYEITLVRLLGYSFGHTFYAVSTVLTTYMAGLASGSRVFGRIADRRPASGLRLYAWLEGAIALYAIPLTFLWMPAMRRIETWIGTTLAPGFGTFLAVKFGFGILLLVPLTFLMGATLPVVTRYATARLEQVGRSIGLLYGCNTLGGVAGAALAGFVLIPSVGIRHTMMTALAINAVVSAVALALARRSPVPADGRVEDRRNDERPEPGPVAAEGSHAPRRLARIVPLVAFLTGAASLGCEVLWSRVFSVLIAPTPYVFTTILIAFLSGLGVGSLLTSERFQDRREDRALALVGTISAIGGLLVLGLYPSLPWIARLLNRIADPSTREGVTWLRWAGFRFATVFAPVFLITTILGMTLPLLMRANARALSALGRTVGDVYAVNTVGAIVGSFVTGFVLLPALGSSRTSLLLGGTFLACAVGIAAAGSRRRVAPIAVISVAAIVAAARTPLYHYASYFGDTASVTPVTSDPFVSPMGIESRIVFHREDPTSTVSVLRTPAGHNILFVEGIITASDTPSVFWNLALKGHLPVLIHPAPKDVLIVGLGAGITLGAVAQHHLDSITVVELSPSVIAAQDLFASQNYRAHERSNVTVIENDGRDFMLTTPRTFDVITADQTDPPVMMLYSKDFYVDARRVLRPGGVFVQWVPLYHMSDRSFLSIVQAFREAFPSVSIWYGMECVFLVGTNGPLSIDVATLRERLSEPAVRASLARFGADHAETLLSTFLLGDADVTRLLAERYPGGPATSDDRPIIEFDVPRERFVPSAQKLRELVSPYVGDVRALLGSEAGAARLDGIDFPKVARKLVWANPDVAADVARGRLDAQALGVTAPELEVIRRFTSGGGPAGEPSPG